MNTLDTRHPKYMHAAARRRLGLIWVKPKWKRKRRRGPVYAKCDDCGINYADPPSKLCPGCQAYQEHQR
jgi:rubrerythrin